MGDQSYEGELYLQRKPNIGVGVFILPFVPLLLLYEPRCDANKQSTATYETSYAFSTELTTSFSTEEATTRPVAPQGYLGVQNAQTKLNTFATVFENVPIPGGEAIPGALRNIASGRGEMEAELTEGQIEATQNSLRTTFKTQDAWSTGENDCGPGIGDILVYLSNVKMLWIAYNGNLTLTPLGWDAEKSHSAQQ